MKNELATERSLYLHQHQDQPVAWQPWSDKTLATAGQLERPVFISIGYSSCHWCHVMAHECFDDPEVAALLNEHFVSIKIDREEHPDVDAQYMASVLLIQGHGGWPMSVFTLPDGRPFFGGTYFPKLPRQGQPGFLELLTRIVDVWNSERDKILSDAQRLTEGVLARSVVQPPVELSADGLHAAVAASLRHFDPQTGGHQGAPKFPPHTDLRLWQHLQQQQPTEEVAQAIATTLEALCWSGLRDQLGGSFHRYCVDEHWQVPHFEQMLYDNAQLLQSLATQASEHGRDADRYVLTQLLVDLQERWITPAATFAAAWDADDAGGEGGFYTWTPEEIDAALLDDATWAKTFFQVVPDGPVDGRCTLYPAGPPTDEDGASAAEQWEDLRHATAVLHQARASRPTPQRDDKAIVAENGMLLTALALASRVMGQRALEPFQAVADRWLDLAATDPLPRAFYDGDSRGHAGLHDVAALALGLLHWGLATDQIAAIERAVELAERALNGFNSDGWSAVRTDLILGSPSGMQDSQQGSAFATMCDLLTDLYAVSGETRWTDEQHSLIHHCSGAMAASPGGTRDLWRAVDRGRGQPQTVFLYGASVQAWYPRLVGRAGAATLWIRPNLCDWLADRDAPALAGKQPGAAYVCSGAACQAPMHHLSELAEWFEGPQAI